MVLSIGHLAYFSIALRYGIQDASRLLNPHLLKHLGVYEKALTKARSLKLSLPRRAGREDIEQLASQIEKMLGELPGWKKVHWSILAYLLIFDAQLIRNEERNASGGRWIHAEVHCRALYFATVEQLEFNDSVIRSFLTADETQEISKTFQMINDEGCGFGAALKSCPIESRGRREVLRVLLDICEPKKVSSFIEKIVFENILKQVNAEWDPDSDPDCSFVRVPGIHLEEMTKRTLESYRKELQTANNIELARLEQKQKILTTLKKQKKPIYTIAPTTFQLGMGIAFFLLMSICFIVTPRDAFSLGIAWWYFQGGALVTGILILLFPFISGTIERNSIDVGGCAGFVAVFLFLLWFIQPETYHFGIAWWHSLLGSLCVGIIIIVGCPFLKSLITSEKIEILIFESSKFLTLRKVRNVA